MSDEPETESNELITTSGVFNTSQNNVVIDETVQQSSKESSKELSNTNEHGFDVLKKIHPIDDGKNTGISRELSEKYRLIALKTSDLIAFTTFDVNLVYTFVSPSHTKLLGYETEDLLGKSGFAFIHEDDKQNIMTILFSYFDAKLKGALSVDILEKTPRIEYRIIDKFGQWHFIRSTVDFVNDELLFISKDITEQKQTEDALRKSEEKFVRAFKSSPVAICITRLSDGKFLEVNKSLEKLIGYSRDELLVHTTIGLNIWMDINERKLLFEELAKTGSVYDREYRFRSKNGDEIFTRYSGEVIDFSGDQCVISVLIDITNYKKAEELLRKNEEKYRLVTENASDVIWTMDMDLHFTYVSPSNEKMTGYSAESFLKISLDKLLTPESVELALQTFAAEMQLENSGERETSRSVTVELNEIKADGSIIPIEARMCLLRDAQQNPVGILGITREITERKKQEAALKKSEEKFVKAFKDSPIAISITRLDDGKFIEINEAFENFFGYSRAELFAQTTIEGGLWFDIKDRNHVVEMLSTKGSVHDSEFKFCTKGGVVKVARCSAEVMDVNDERCFLSVIVDVTEQKKIEESLRESEAKYRGIVENTKDVIILTLPNGTVSYMSPACAEIFGYTPDELLGALPEIFHPEDKDKVRAVLASALQGKSGTNFEYRILTKQGSVKWISYSWSPIYMDNQKLKYIVSIARDITESKLFEQNLREKIEELERYKNVTVDREVKMMELKNEINELYKQLKQKPRYPTG